MYAALAKLLKTDELRGMLPQLIADWEAEVMIGHAAKTQTDEKARGIKIAAGFAEFRVDELEPPDVITFLRPFKHKRRTHNLYRAQIGELMRFAIEKRTRSRT